MHKRKHGRVKAESVAGQVQTEGNLPEATRVENLSMGGALLRTSQPIPVSSPVVLQLHRVGMQRPLLVTGRVVSTVALKPEGPRRSTVGLGIAFDPLDGESKRILAELLRRLAPAPTVLEGDRAPGEAAAAPTAPSGPPLAPAPRPVPARSGSRPIVLGGGPPVLQPIAEAPRPPPSASVVVPESARLQVQMRGLLSELHQANQRAANLERENEQLRKRVAALTEELNALRRG